MSKTVTVAEAAKILGITDAAVRQRVYSGSLKGKKLSSGKIMVMLNGDEPAAPKRITTDPVELIAEELISLGRRLKKAVKEHDDKIRREVIEDIGASLMENAKKG